MAPRTFFAFIGMMIFIVQAAFSQSVKVTEATWQGDGCWKIETPWATMYFEKANGVSGFKSVIDLQGNDWLQADVSLGYGHTPEYRGFPNATGSNFGHPSRNSGTTNTIIGASSGEHVIIEAVSASMKFRYHFFATHGAIEVLTANETYCFLWEGMNGPSTESTDFFVTSDGVKRYAGDNNTFHDIANEWLYFGDANLNNVFLMGKRPDDTQWDENWRELGQFELYSFGRSDKTNNCNRYLTGTSNYFVWTMLPKSTSHADMTATITSLFAKPYEPFNREPPVLTTVSVTPASASVVPGGTRTFSAVAKDQYGSSMPTQPAFTWTLSGGGSISSSGIFNAGNSAGGPYTITATTGAKSGTATVTVATFSGLKIDCGATTPATGWESDAAYLVNGQTGEAYTFPGTISTTGVTNAAPAGVYASVRHFNHAYNFSGVPNGTYTVRLHFADGSGGNRAMDYTVEGVKVIENLNIETQAGGLNKAYVKTLTVNVTDNNGLQISCDKDGGDDVFESAIEILAGNPTAIGAAQASIAGAAIPKIQAEAGKSISVTWRGNYQVRIFNAMGGLVHAANAEGTAPYAWKAKNSGGVYFVKCSSGATSHIRRVLIK